MLRNRTLDPMKACKQVALAVVMVLVLVPGLALTQTAAAGAAAEHSADMKAMIRDFRKAAEALQDIRKKTIQTNPELKARYGRFQDELRNAMTGAGYDVESNRKRLKAIGKQLRSRKISKNERQKLADELDRIRHTRDQARAKVLQMQDIQSAQHELREATLAAMLEQNGETETMIKFMNALRNKLLSMKKSTQSAGGPDGGTSTHRK